MTDDLDRRINLLRTHLQAAVPLRMAEMTHLTDERVAEIGREAGASVAENGHSILWKTTDTRRSVHDLVSGLAALAVTTAGGVTFAGAAGFRAAAESVRAMGTERP